MITPQITYEAIVCESDSRYCDPQFMHCVALLPKRELTEYKINSTTLVVFKHSLSGLAEISI